MILLNYHSYDMRLSNVSDITTCNARIGYERHTVEHQTFNDFHRGRVRVVQKWTLFKFNLQELFCLKFRL